MKPKSRTIIIFTILFGYILLQFLWWEILLVRQNGQIISEKEKVVALTTLDDELLKKDLADLRHHKTMQTVMIVGEGTVFLLLLLFGVYKIKQAQDKETALSNQQKNFFLSITHELKTPIAATKLQLQTLQKQKLDENTQQELITNALQETERLNMLIDNVLLANRLDAGEFIFKKEKQDLGKIVPEILQRYYKNEIAKAELKITSQENLFSEVDVHALTSVITNLVDNAIKYSRLEKNISVELEKQKDSILLRVKDSGVGISNEDKRKVFHRFFRAGNEETRNSKGTGLGLYIVKYILNNHRAKIKVKDNVPKGSVFEIQFHAA